jgi:hypothetical protein
MKNSNTAKKLGAGIQREPEDSAVTPAPADADVERSGAGNDNRECSTRAVPAQVLSLLGMCSEDIQRG